MMNGEQDFLDALEQEEARDQIDADGCPIASCSANPVSKSGRPARIGVQIKDPPVSERRDYVPCDEGKRGPLHRAIPTMPLSLAVTCCVFNIVLPGIGTIIASFSVFCCGTTGMTKPVHACALNLASGLLQLATFILILGWIWSIIWGMTFVHLSLSAKKSQQVPLVPYYVRRHSSVDF